MNKIVQLTSVLISVKSFMCLPKETGLETLSLEIIHAILWCFFDQFLEISGLGSPMTQEENNKLAQFGGILFRGL